MRRGADGRPRPGAGGVRRARPGAARPAAAPQGEQRLRTGLPPPSPLEARAIAPAARGAIAQLLARQPWDALRPALAVGGVEVDRALERLREYAQLLLEWNRGVSNIMSKHDEDRVVERHLLESIAPARWLAGSGAGRWVDFGSGAGLPAIPLALVGVGPRWTLVESRRTKTLFVRKTIHKMQLDGFEVINDRLENVVAEGARREAFDGFTSRATMRVGPTLAMASALVAPGGSAFLWKGSGHEEEMEQDPSWRSSWERSETRPVGSGPNVVVRFLRK